MILFRIFTVEIIAYLQKYFVMIVVNRDIYLQKLIRSKQNGMIKVITGVRRCGKSYLLFNLFCEHLQSSGVDDDHIIKVDLEDRRNKAL